MASIEIHTKIIDQIKEDGLKKILGSAFYSKCFFFPLCTHININVLKGEVSFVAPGQRMDGT